MTSLSQKEDLGIGTDATHASLQGVDMDASARFR